MANGLTGVYFVRCWISWSILPLSCRTGLMCEYTGAKNDPLRHSPDDLPAHVIDDMTKSLLNESLADCGKVVLAPFCKANPTPKVNHPYEMTTLIS